MPMTSNPFEQQALFLLKKIQKLWPLESVSFFTYKNDCFNIFSIGSGSEKKLCIEPAPKPENPFIIFSFKKNGTGPFFHLLKKYKLDTLSCNFLPGDDPVLIGLSWPGAFKAQKEVEIAFAAFFNLYNQFYFKNKLQESTNRASQIMSEVTVMHEISRAFEDSNSLDNLLHYIVEKSRLIMHTESASLMLHLEKTNELEFKVVLGPKSKEVKPFRLPVGQGISGWVAQKQEPILIADAYKDPRFDPSFDVRSGYKTRSILCVPMVHKHKTIGVMTVLNRIDDKPFVEDDKNLMMTFASQAALAIENARLLIAELEKERLDKELQVASEIQNLLIPNELPKIPYLEISATYLPCKEVSGDFYDVIKLDENRYAFVVADVAGKGIPAAMLVSTMQATLSAYLEGENDLVTIVEELNLNIIKKSTDDTFITFFISIYDVSTSTITYVNAGHNPPILLQDEKPILLNKGGLFLGYIPWQYESETIKLKEKDILTLYTDGLVEAMNEAQEEFSDERLEKVILRQKAFSPKKILRKIKNEVNTHIKHSKLADDFTLLIIKKVKEK